jgi:hypothetical protein
MSMRKTYVSAPPAPIGECAVEIPGERKPAVFVVLEPLEFLDEVELEFDGHPGGKLEGDVLVAERATVTAGLGSDADCPGLLDPLLRREGETVQPGLHSNPVEFDGIKLRVVELLPDSEEFDGVAIAQPVADDVVGVVRILEFGDIREADVVLLLFGKDGDGRAPDFDDGFLGLAHGLH